MKKTSTPRTLSIGGSTYDLFVRTDAAVAKDAERAIVLPLGTKIRVKDVIETCGGGAGNTAVGLARLGCAAGFHGVLGSDQWGQRLLANFRKEGVDTSSATVVEGETSSFSIILSVTGGERVILYNVGTNAHLRDSTFDVDAVGRADWIYVNHLHEESCVIQNDLLAALAREPRPRMTWNPGGGQIAKGITERENAALLRVTDLLILNKEEAFAFTNTQTIEAAMQSLLASGARTVCITDGKNGAYGSQCTSNQESKTNKPTNQQTIVHCPPTPAHVIDTTGAGDAFGVGATWAMIHGLDLPTVLRAGSVDAASVLESIGAQAGLLTDTDMTQRLSSL